MEQDNAAIMQILAKLIENSTEIKRELNQVTESVIRIENEHGAKIKALFDAREFQLEVNERILDTLQRVEGKVDRLTLKVSSHDLKLKNAK